ncbi:MAG: ATP-dependent helicase C-terminal domain-containing protein [Pseudomonadota bacterium]
MRAMGALDSVGRITALGEAIVEMPMAPHQAAALLYAADAGLEDDTARLVMLLQERGLGGRSEDLVHRLERWRGETSRRAQTARRVAQGWADRARKAAITLGKRPREPADALALARPDFVARRRDPSGEHWVSAGGRGFTLERSSPLARAQWIVIGEAQGAARAARITAGLELSLDRVENLFESRLQSQSVILWNEDKKRIEARRERGLGAIKLASVPDPDPDPDAIANRLAQEAITQLGDLLPPGFLARAQYAGVEAMSEDSLKETADIWLKPLLEKRRDLDIAAHRLAEAALGPLDWNARQQLEERAPTHFASPAGTRHAIDYTGDDAPSVEVRVQALFGLDSHPMIGSTALLLKLTSPAGQPIQSTRDLPGFWRGSWADVAKDMKGRYSKHRWPEHPWLEKPSLKTKNAFNRD